MTQGSDGDLLKRCVWPMFCLFLFFVLEDLIAQAGYESTILLSPFSQAGNTGLCHHTDIGHSY